MPEKDTPVTEKENALKPRKYPLPLVFPNMNEWAIARLAKDRDGIMEEMLQITKRRILQNKRAGNLADRIAKVVYMERDRIVENPWRVDPPDEMDFWSDVRQELLHGLTDATDEQSREAHNEAQLERILRRYIHEITGQFTISTYRLAQKVLPAMFGTLLNTANFFKPKRKLHERMQLMGAIDDIRSLASKGTIILMPTHFSNLDSILVGLSADRIGLTAFTYGAGLNLYNTKILAYYFSRLGAYTLDRRKKNEFYLETLKTYSQTTIEKGVHTLFFPGGTRSRSGNLESRLKMGLMGTVIDAQCAMALRNEKTKVFIVPVVINYHFVLEAKNLIEQYLKDTGKELYLVEKKAFGGAWNLLKFLWNFFSSESEIVVNFGRPIDVLGNFVDAEGISYDQFGRAIELNDYFVSDGVMKYDRQRNEEYTKRLAKVLVDRYHVENIVLSSHLVAFTAFRIFQAQYPRLDLYGVLRIPRDDRNILKTTFYSNIERLREELRRMEQAGKLKLQEIVRSGSLEELIAHGIKNCGAFHVKKVLKRDREGDITSEDMNLLYYYHNRLDCYGLERFIQVDVVR